jgi:biopolymer transport protein ExbB
VIAYGLRDAERGPDAVAELCRGALGMERLRYERGLAVLATIGSNGPFIGLFGTVMGVIMAFDQLRTASAAADTGQSSAVMGAIAEALIATGVGLLVAIPAILFFNILKSRVKGHISTTNLLVDTMIAYLRSESRSNGG